MRSLQRKSILGILYLVTFAIHTLNASANDDITLKFTRTDSTYTFSGSFNIKADPACILDICFKHEHIKALAPDAEEVILNDEGVGWNRISYKYSKFIWFENESEWHRKLDKEKRRVVFKMLSSKNNRSIMPEMLSSSGFYQLSVKGQKVKVEFYQECVLSESTITKIYINRAENDAVKFIQWFLEYVKQVCSDN